MSIGVQFLSEVVGTAMLLLLGAGVVATAILTKSKGLGGGWLLISVGWGLAVFTGVTVSYASGAYLNPAVVVGALVAGTFKGGFGTALLFMLAELIGAFIGAVLAWAAFKRHFDEETDPGTILGVFSTGPAIRSYGWNLVTEIIGTFVLVFAVIGFGKGGTPAGTRRPARRPRRRRRSAPPSVARPGTRSTPPVTSAPASPTRSCPSATRARATGPTPGCPSSAR